MNDRQLSTTVLDRLDHIRDNDLATVTALAVYQDVAGQLEADNPALFRRLDAAIAHVYAALMQACWKDGYAVALDPTLLIFTQRAQPAVSMPFTWKVVADGVEIAQSLDEYVDDVLDGEGGAA